MRSRRIMCPDKHDRNLLVIESATIFVLTDSGRILRKNTPDHAAGPRFHLLGCPSGNVARIRHDVGEGTARAIESLAAGEPDFPHPDSTPIHLDDYLRLLAAEAQVERYDMGLVWTFPDRLDYEHPAALAGSDTPAGDCLLAHLTERGMPEALTALGFVNVGEFWAPWGASRSMATRSRPSPLRSA